LSMLKKKIIKFFWAAWFAYGYFWLTIIIFNNVAARSMIATTVLNFVLILVFLIEDKIGDYFTARQNAKQQTKQSTVKRIVRAYFNSVSFKTAIYLFYIFVLVCSAIERVEPGFFSEHFSLYLLSVEYGILVLIALDTFLSQFFKDVAAR